MSASYPHMSGVPYPYPYPYPYPQMQGPSPCTVPETYGTPGPSVLHAAPGSCGTPGPYWPPSACGAPGSYAAPGPYGQQMAPVPGYYQPPPPPYSACFPYRSYFFIRSRVNGLVLDVQGGNPAPGTPVVLWKQKETDNSNQLWFEDSVTGTIRSKLNEYCLDVDGSQVVLKPYQPGNVNQLWERSAEFIRNCHQPNRLITVDMLKPGSGGRILITNNNKTKKQTAQMFDFQLKVPEDPAAAMAALNISQPSPRRRFYIVSEMHCKVLDVKGADPVSGVDAIMWPKKSGYHPNQLWYFDSEGVIRSALNDMALDSGVGGRNIQMMPYRGDARQQWRLVGNRILNNAHECLDISGESRKDGAAVISYKYKGSANQHWRIEYE